MTADGTISINDYGALRREALSYAREEGFLNRTKNLVSDATTETVKFVQSIRVPSAARLASVFAATLFAAVLLALAFPPAASANFIDDILGMASNAWETVINGIVSVLNGTIIEPLCDGILKGLLKIIADSVSASDLLNGFDNMLGSYRGSFNAAKLVSSVSNAAVKPIAATLLAMGMLLQLLKIAKKMDQGGGMMPSVREVVTLFVWCAIMMYMVRNGIGIVQDFYSLVLDVIKKASETASGYGDPSKTLGAWAAGDKLIKFGDGSTIVDGIGALLACLLAWILGNFAIIISYAAMLGRAIEIYVMAMFAPIPFALMGFDETRSWGWGYIRNFLALCLAGVVMVVTLYLFPYIVVSILGNSSSHIIEVTNVLSTLVKVVAACLVLAMTLVKSTQIARSVLGG